MDGPWTTNLNRKRMRRVLPAAVAAAGLTCVGQGREGPLETNTGRSLTLRDSGRKVAARQQRQPDQSSLSLKRNCLGGSRQCSMIHKHEGLGTEKVFVEISMTH